MKCLSLNHVMKFLSLRGPNKSGPYWRKSKVFKIYFIALNESKMIQLQFETNRIKIDPL